MITVELVALAREIIRAVLLALAERAAPALSSLANQGNPSRAAHRISRGTRLSSICGLFFSVARPRRPILRATGGLEEKGETGGNEQSEAATARREE